MIDRMGSSILCRDMQPPVLGLVSSRDKRPTVGEHCGKPLGIRWRGITDAMPTHED